MDAFRPPVAPPVPGYVHGHGQVCQVCLVPHFPFCPPAPFHRPPVPCLHPPPSDAFHHHHHHQQLQHQYHPQGQQFAAAPHPQGPSFVAAPHPQGHPYAAGSHPHQRGPPPLHHLGYGSHGHLPPFVGDQRQCQLIQEHPNPWDPRFPRPLQNPLARHHAEHYLHRPQQDHSLGPGVADGMMNLESQRNHVNSNNWTDTDREAHINPNTRVTDLKHNIKENIPKQEDIDRVFQNNLKRKKSISREEELLIEKGLLDDDESGYESQSYLSPSKELNTKVGQDQSSCHPSKRTNFGNELHQQNVMPSRAMYSANEGSYLSQPREEASVRHGVQHSSAENGMTAFQASQNIYPMESGRARHDNDSLQRQYQQWEAEEKHMEAIKEAENLARQIQQRDHSVPQFKNAPTCQLTAVETSQLQPMAQGKTASTNEFSYHSSERQHHQFGSQQGNYHSQQHFGSQPQNARQQHPFSARMPEPMDRSQSWHRDSRNQYSVSSAHLHNIQPFAQPPQQVPFQPRHYESSSHQNSQPSSLHTRLENPVDSRASLPGNIHQTGFPPLPTVVEIPPPPPPSDQSNHHTPPPPLPAGSPVTFPSPIVPPTRGSMVHSQGYQQQGAPFMSRPTVNQVVSPTQLSRQPLEKSKIVDAVNIFRNPGRMTRPDRFVIILRGLPGSGKSYLAKSLRDVEVMNGGSAPRIHSMDDYFMSEVEKVEEVESGNTNSRNKKKVVKRVMEYCYEPEMLEIYRASMQKAFKKTLDEGMFNFVIVDDRNVLIADFAQFWAIAKRSGYEAYVLEAPYTDVKGCAARNVHSFTEEQVKAMADKWEQTPSLYLKLDVSSLFRGDELNSQDILEVEMDADDAGNDINEDETAQACDVIQDETTCEMKERHTWGDRWKDNSDLAGEASASPKSGKFIHNHMIEADNLRKTNNNALSGLMTTYGKKDKFVHWSDNEGAMSSKAGFSIGSVSKKKASLIIGPGAGYNATSNPVIESNKDSMGTESRTSRRFLEQLRAEQESFKAVFARRRQRIHGMDDDEED